MMTMKYPREAIVAAIDTLTQDEFVPITQAIEGDGVHPFMAEAAIHVARDLTEEVTSIEGVVVDESLLATAAEVGLLHGVRIGLRLAENEARLEKVLDQMKQDGGLMVSRPHFTCEAHAVRLGLEFFTFDKVGQTRLARVNGPFSCQAKEGTLTCNDGWLALDADGDPYPVDDDVFKRLYALAQ